jgi:hypothetical protein
MAFAALALRKTKKIKKRSPQKKFGKKPPGKILAGVCPHTVQSRR